MIKIIAAALMLSLLTIASAAYAVTLYEDVDLKFGSNELTGQLGFSPYNGAFNFDPSYYYTAFSVSAGPNLSYNGTLVTTVFDYAGKPRNPELTDLMPVGFFLDISTSDIRNLNFTDFTEEGFGQATSGTVACVSACNEVNVVPLPASLPMFGAALLSLLGFSWWKGRNYAKKVGNSPRK